MNVLERIKSLIQKSNPFKNIIEVNCHEIHKETNPIGGSQVQTQFECIKCGLVKNRLNLFNMVSCVENDSERSYTKVEEEVIIKELFDRTMITVASITSPYSEDPSQPMRVLVDPSITNQLLELTLPVKVKLTLKHKDENTGMWSIIDYSIIDES